MRKILISIVVLALLSACSPEPEGDVVGIWELESVAVSGVFVAMPDALLSGERAVPELEIRDDGVFSMSGPCNTYSGDGTYGSRFLPRNAAATQAGCLTEDLTEFEDQLFAVISDEPLIEFGTGQAMQLQGNTTTLTFRRQP